jgi:hypothetical protein
MISRGNRHPIRSGSSVRTLVIWTSFGRGSRGGIGASGVGGSMSGGVCRINLRLSATISRGNRHSIRSGSSVRPLVDGRINLRLSAVISVFRILSRNLRLSAMISIIPRGLFASMIGISCGGVRAIFAIGIIWISCCYSFFLGRSRSALQRCKIFLALSGIVFCKRHDNVGV